MPLDADIQQTDQDSVGEQNISLTHMIREESQPTNIKSVRHVICVPNNKRLLEAVSHLKQAIYLDGQFPAAHYDVGLTYRMLGQFDDAIFVFSEIQRLDDVAIVQKIRAIEQIGFTKLDIAANVAVKETREKLIKEAKEILWEAIELQSTNSDNFPHFKAAWASYSTLKTIADSVQELIHLHYAMKNSKEAIALYEFFYEGDELEAIDRKNMIEMYMEAGEYHKAVLLLNILSSAEDSRSLVDGEFFVSVHLRAAADSLSYGMFMKAANRFNTAYRHIRNSSEHAKGVIDVIIMHDCMDNPDCPCELVLRIQKWLKIYVNLNVTINDEDCVPGRPIEHYYRTLFEVCSTIMVVFHNDNENSENLYYVRAPARMPIYYPKLVILSDRDLVNDICFGSLPRLRIPTAEEEEGSEWIKEFMQHLLISR